MPRNKILMKDIWKYIIGIGIGILIGLLLNTTCTTTPNEPEIIYTEVHDTITVRNERIKYKTKVESVIVMDTFYIANQDTTILKNIPIEYKEYIDTISTDSTSTKVNIKYHGFNADIDNLQLDHMYNNKTEINYIQPKKWGVDIVVGPSIGWDWYIGGPAYGNFTAGINVTLGIGYRLTK